MKIKRYAVVLKWIGLTIAAVGIIFAIFYDIFKTHVCVVTFAIHTMYTVCFCSVLFLFV